MTPTAWCALDMGFLIWREFYGAARRDPAAAVEGAVECALGHAGAFGEPLFLFDRGPYRRAALYPGYKAKRNDAQADPAEAELKADVRRRADALCEDMRRRGSRVFGTPGFEADDHAGRVARDLPPGHALTIVSRDRDLLQLLRPRVSLLDPCTGRLHTYKAFRAEWLDLHPVRWAEVKAIAGCSSDEVPGVWGVGEKTAARYLADALGPTHAARAKIETFLGTPEYSRNLELCRLPFPGTPPAALE